MMKLIIIVAMSKNGVIGKGGEIPWRHPQDLQRFANITKGFPVIMGRKTYESIVATLGKPLPKRKNIVITKNKSYVANGCIVVHSFKKAVRVAEDIGERKAFVIGGAQVYKDALPLADALHISLIDLSCEGDTYFPGHELFTKNPVRVDGWETISQKSVSASAKKNIPACTFFYYERKKFVDIGNIRDPKQEKVMLEILENKECPFCQENLHKYHSKRIFAETKHWLITYNQWPYEHTKFHFLAIYKSHAEKFREIEPEAGKELFVLCAELEKGWGLPGGAICLRFGNTDYSGGTVNHLHAQLIVPDINSDTYKRVQFSIGKK